MQKAYQPTGKQFEVLRLIATWSEGRPRAARLATHLGLSDANVVRSRLRPLVEHGYLQRSREAPGYPEDFTVTPAGLTLLGLSSAPPGAKIIKGGTPCHARVFPGSCGPTKPALSEGEEITTLADIFPNFRPGDFLIDADGDSMVDPRNDADSIYPGDRLHCRPDIAPSNGETVYAQFLNDGNTPECAIGIYHLDERTGQVKLTKLNPTYPAIKRPGEGVIVHGIVISAVRRLRGSNRK